MKRSFLRSHGKSGLELIEEAFVLLRTCPAATLASYYFGSVPFVAGFLIFCSDLSRHPEAPDHLGGATLAMTALFIWMKFFQARFGRQLLARLRGAEEPSRTAGEVFHSACLQTIFHATALFILPVASVLVLPFGWIYAFYQSITALDDSRSRLGALFQSASRQSALWPAQNHFLLLTLSGFGLFVFLNWITLGFLAPQLLKMFLGIESVFTRSPLSLFNTTFFAATISLTYLCLDPLIKACYVLRCFYGQSLHSGDDLKTEVRRLSGRTPALAAFLLLCFLAPALPAAENAPAPTPAVAGSELDRSISTVIQHSKYTWRTPREKKVAEKKEGLFHGFFKSISLSWERVLDAIGDLFKKIMDWLFPRNRESHDSSQSGWGAPQLGLLFLVLALVACGLGVAALRTIRSRRRSVTVDSIALAAVPDLEDENTAANDLPEDDWTMMGRRLLEQGDLRRALRAFYLASLAHLASRGFITIARFKSNRDYERELRRRGHAVPELPVLFGENVGIFDRIWYGLHEVDPDLVQRFVGNLEKMKGLA